MLSILGKLLKRKTLERDRFDALYAEAAGAAAAREFERAVSLYDEAIALDPAHAEAYYKRGNALRLLGRLDAALASYDQAIERRPDYAYAYCNRGVVQHGLGLMTAALSSYDQAIAIDAADAVTHYNRALLMQDRSQWDEALAGYDRAISIDPGYADAQYNRSLALLLQGDFANGWRAYEWRWPIARRLGIGEPREFAQPLWLGEESIAGKRLLLYSEGGLGDTLQFCRYAALCAARGANVLLEVEKPLLGLLANLQGVSQLIPAGTPLPPFDYQCPLMSLPLAIKTTLRTIPAARAYLRADEAKVAGWRRRIGERSRPCIGLVWSGNPNSPIDHRRSIALADWLAHLPTEFQYFCLQNRLRDADKAALASFAAIGTFVDDLRDFVDTAALCECMDVVISVDTSLAHLSAALGKRTWVLLPIIPDWRWLRNRDDSPWYPTAKLYRQNAVGGWNEVLSRVGGDLRREFL